MYQLQVVGLLPIYGWFELRYSVEFICIDSDCCGLMTCVLLSFLFPSVVW